MNPYIKFVKICDFAFFGAPFLYPDFTESFCDRWGVAILKKNTSFFAETFSNRRNCSYTELFCTVSGGDVSLSVK